MKRIRFLMLLVTVMSVAFVSSAVAQNCAEIIADTGRYASPKNFSTPKTGDEGIRFEKRFNFSGKVEYHMNLKTYNPEFYPDAQVGLTIHLTNEKKISHPELRAFGVKCTNRGGCIYEVDLALSEQELKLLQEQKITSYTVGKFTTKVPDGDKYIRLLNCLIKANVK